MHKAPLAICLAVLVILAFIIYLLQDFIAPLLNIVFFIVLGSFILVFGFLLGIKFMSEIGK
jgi:sugar phosphate permease